MLYRKLRLKALSAIVGCAVKSLKQFRRKYPGVPDPPLLVPQDLVDIAAGIKSAEEYIAKVKNHLESFSVSKDQTEAKRLTERTGLSEARTESRAEIPTEETKLLKYPFKSEDETEAGISLEELSSELPGAQEDFQFKRTCWGDSSEKAAHCGRGRQWSIVSENPTETVAPNEDEVTEAKSLTKTKAPTEAKPLTKAKDPPEAKSLSEAKAPPEAKPLTTTKDPTEDKSLIKTKDPPEAKSLTKTKAPPEAKPLTKTKAPPEAKPLTKTKAPPEAKSLSEAKDPPEETNLLESHSVKGDPTGIVASHKEFLNEVVGSREDSVSRKKIQRKMSMRTTLSKWFQGRATDSDIAKKTEDEVSEVKVPSEAKPLAKADVQTEAGALRGELFINEEDFFDIRYDYDFTHVKDRLSQFKRGGESYRRPCGWMRFGLKVQGKYEDGDGWLGEGNDAWPVSYHGTTVEGVEGIITTDYKAGPCQQYGRGIYLTPDVTVALVFSKSVTSQTTKKTYNIILQNRINPKRRTKCERKDYWLVRVSEGTSTNANAEELDSKKSVRPYGLLLREVKEKAKNTNH